MNKTALASGLLTVPGVSVGIDFLRSTDIGTTISDVTGTVNGIMEVGNSTINPLFSSVVGGTSAGLLTNSVLKEFDWMKNHNKTRWVLNGLATFAGYSAGTVAAPYLAAGGLAYAVGKYGWKPGKELIKRTGGVAWGLTGGLVKGMAVGAFNSIKAGAKGQQKLNPVIN